MLVVCVAVREPIRSDSPGRQFVTTGLFIGVREREEEEEEVSRLSIIVVINRARRPIDNIFLMPQDFTYYTDGKY